MQCITNIICINLSRIVYSAWNQDEIIPTERNARKKSVRSQPGINGHRCFNLSGILGTFMHWYI